jgi:hypothetical protein
MPLWFGDSQVDYKAFAHHFPKLSRMGGRKGTLFAGREFRTIDEDEDIRGS